MSQRIPFVKMHGLGNDYVYLDERELSELGITLSERDAPEWSRRVADRHRGIGGDGLIIVRVGENTAVRMEMYNADGSRAEMCGNGIRCVARLAWERGYAESKEFVIESDSGPRPVAVLENGTQVAVDMGEAKIDAPLTLVSEGREFTGTPVDLGNPHFVIEIPERPSDFPVERYGPPLETNERFPNRANIEFVHATARDHILFRVWERGSGETQACGTGATAAAAALHSHGKTEARATVSLLGGDLTIEVKDGTTWMTGPAQTSFTGEFSIELVS